MHGSGIWKPVQAHIGTTYTTEWLLHNDRNVFIGPYIRKITLAFQALKIKGFCALLQKENEKEIWEKKEKDSNLRSKSFDPEFTIGHF